MDNELYDDETNEYLSLMGFYYGLLCNIVITEKGELEATP